MTKDETISMKRAMKLAQDWHDSGNENPDDFADMIKTVIALAQQPAQQQELVKVGRIADNIKGMVLRQEVMLYTDDYLPIGTALYTSPPTLSLAQRKPPTASRRKTHEQRSNEAGV